MIFDKIENADLNKGINKGIAKALTYIETTNVSNLPLGKHEIDGDDVYAISSEYITKDESQTILEAHCKYIDIQYMVNGVENIGVTTFKNQDAVKLYDEENDYMLFNEPYSLTSLNQGMFAIFFPDDLHMPGIKVGEIAKVKKIVIKVKI